MPFVQRVVTPRRLSRAQLHDPEGRPTLPDGELEAVTNFTLSNALRQLASVVRIAQEVFDGLNRDLAQVARRSSQLKDKITSVQVKVNDFDPKAVTVPVGDLSWFTSRTGHYQRPAQSTEGLFTAESRPEALCRLYEAAAEPRPPPRSASLTVTPVLGATRRRQANLPQVDIETSKPALLRGLRRWTSSEALGSLTVDPDSTLRVNPSDLVDHTLPSPEEQLHAIANRFPAEMVRVDVSGKSFQRMTNFRRSLMNVEYDDTVRRRKGRRPRGKRRNTIAGTDSKELQAIVSESSETVVGKSCSPESVQEKKSHLESLKEWGLGRLRQLRQTEVRLRATAARKWEDANPHSSSGNWSASSESGHSTTTTHHPRSSISSGSMCGKHRRPIMVSTSSSVTSESTLTPDDCDTGSMYSCDTEGYYTSFHLDSGLKPLREEEPSPALQSTSALSQVSTLTADSEYELFGRGSTSTTASSAGTVCTTLLGSAPPPPARGGSQLSGNKTFPERSRPTLDKHTHSLKLDKTSDLKLISFKDTDGLNPSNTLTKENLSKLNNFEPDSKCMITVDVHANRNGTPEKCGDSPDSGHNTCSSPVDSVASPSIDMEMSECSDLEGVDRVERIREKTTINSSRIPSMCVITPPQSDDEVSLKQFNKSIDSGEYVTIADVRQNIIPQIPITRPSEYVSLNELPNKDSLERRRQGARVTLDSEGKVIYASDSLKRKKSIHTTGTFEPGPCVASSSSLVPSRVINVRPVQMRSPINIQKINNQTKILNTDSALLQKESNIQNDFRKSNQSPMPVKKNGVNYFPRSSYERMSPSRSCRPLSPPVAQVTPATLPSANIPIIRAKSPTKSLSPLVSRGAYVRIQQPSDDLSLSETSHMAVKRSDSYRLANQEVFNPNSLGRKQYGAGIVASPSLLTALHEAQTPKVPLEAEKVSTPTNVESSSVVSPQPQSTSTPTKHNSSQGLDCSSVPSPIEKSPSRNTRSAMDLFAIIHDSKKRIQSLQKGSPVEWPKVIPGKVTSLGPNYNSLKNMPRPMSPLNNVDPHKYTKHSVTFNSLPRMKIQTYDESPRNILQRKHYEKSSEEKMTPSSRMTRNDFKRLLLQTGAGASYIKESAVSRLKNKELQKPIKYDILSTTIPEDCESDENGSRFVPKSSALVSAQNKAFQARASPTLETSL